MNDNLEILNSVCILLNTVSFIFLTWINRDLIYKIIQNIGYFTIDILLRTKTYFDITYTVYIQPFMEKKWDIYMDIYMDKIFCSKDTKYDKQNITKIKLFLSDDTIVELKNNQNLVEDSSNLIIGTNEMFETEIMCVVMEKYDNKLDKWNGLIYNDYNEYLLSIKGENPISFPCDFDFMTINITIEEENYAIDLSSPINYYMSDNLVLDKWFLKYYLKSTYDYDMVTDKYSIYIMDQNINEIIFGSNKYIKFNKMDYKLCCLKEDVVDDNSPSEDSE